MIGACNADRVAERSAFTRKVLRGSRGNAVAWTTGRCHDARRSASIRLPGLGRESRGVLRSGRGGVGCVAAVAGAGVLLCSWVVFAAC